MLWSSPCRCGYRSWAQSRCWDWLVSCCCGTWVGHVLRDHAGIEGVLYCMPFLIPTQRRKHARILLCMALCNFCCPGTFCKRSVPSRSLCRCTRADPLASAAAAAAAAAVSAAAAAVAVRAPVHWVIPDDSLPASLIEECAYCRSRPRRSAPRCLPTPLPSLLDYPVSLLRPKRDP